jgi:hypothetical protein
LHAQDAPPVAELPELPTIADEPKAIDPAAFMPPQMAADVTVDFTGSSLREVLNWLREEQDLVVLLENDALSEIGVLPGDPISDQLDETPLYLLVNRLRSLGLAWYFEDEILHITSEEVAAERLTTLPYSIGDLLDTDYDVDVLHTVIENTIAPDSWEELGGAGVVSFLGDVMFVRQTDVVQRQIRGLLAALRQHGRRTFVLDPPQHSLLRQELQENVSVAFRDTPLETAVLQLAETAEIDIRLDLPALREARVREREPVTLSLTDRKLKTVLQAMLIDLDLTWILQDGVLWITSHTKADEFLKTAVYDVRDLCRDDAESDALSEAITSQTEPEWWDHVGGPGTIEFALPGTLVIHNTEKALGDVLDLLETYRAALRASKPRQRAQDDPDRIITVYYRMHAGIAEDLSTLLPKLLRPETWRSDTQREVLGEIFRATSAPELSSVETEPPTDSEAQQPAQSLVTARAVLIIRQTQAVHDEIEDVIQRVESGDAPMTGGMGGGGGFGGGFMSVEPAKPGPRP